MERGRGETDVSGASRTQSVNEGGREEEDGSCRRGRKEREREETERRDRERSGWLVVLVGWLCWLVGWLCCVVSRCVVELRRGRAGVT